MDNIAAALIFITKKKNEAFLFIYLKKKSLYQPLNMLQLVDNETYPGFSWL